MSVTADEINYLIHRYLEESSCPHSAFIFGSECRLDQANIQTTQLPPQALLTILKKGVLYMQLEKGITEKAKINDSPESIIVSLTESVRKEEPIIPVKPSAIKPKQNTTSISTRMHNKAFEPVMLPSSSALFLCCHTKEVYCGSWSPDGRYFASGSADANACIWEIREHQHIQHFVLDHATQHDRNEKDISTLSWNPNSTILATGCLDGTIRLWNNRGELKFVLSHHESAIYTVQFSPDGTNLLSGSKDRKIILWNVLTGEIKQIFGYHQLHVLDIDWRDDTYFASCSGDNHIAIWQVGQTTPKYDLRGHQAEVNQISWDVTKKYLASCSDDRTVRIWTPFDNNEHIILQGHTAHVYTVKWSPNDPKLLISGAFDQTVRIWDIMNGTCLYTFTKHSQPIYSLCFSPKGNYFLSGALDMTLNIWRVSDFALIGSYQAKGGLFQAHWDPSGKNIAMCLSDGTIAVLSTENILLYDE